MSALYAHANAPTTLNVAFGSSVPQDSSGQTYVEKAGPSRANGGEHFVLKLNAAKMITSIKITGFSLSHSGKSLIHSATAVAGATHLPLPALFQFTQVTAGNPANSKGLVLLADNSFVEATPNQALSQLDLVIEGYSNDDASFLLQITTTDEWFENQFMLTRTGPHSEQSVGALINEENYAKFSSSDLNKLMLAGTPAQATDLVSKTFVCSSYTKLDSPEINLKKRTYFSSANGSLQSSSDLEGTNLNWSATSAGLTTPIANQNGCGTYTTYNVLRRTPSGNLIAEINLDLKNYVQLCTNAGYDAVGTQAIETNSTFPSVIDPNFVVDSYEFCHLAN